jgi:hypothetical protein
MTHTFASPRRERRPGDETSWPSNKRGRRECRADVRTRSLVCEMKKHTSIVTTGSPNAPAFPARLVLTVSFVLAPETGLCCLRHPRETSASQEFDISVGISGPHDFAVRCPRVRLSRVKASIASRAQRLMTIAKRPSIHGHGTRGKMPLICPTPQAKRLRHVNATGKSLKQREILSSEEQLLCRRSGAMRQHRARNPSPRIVTWRNGFSVSFSTSYVRDDVAAIADGHRHFRSLKEIATSIKLASSSACFSDKAGSSRATHQ